MANAVPQWLFGKNVAVSAKVVSIAGDTGVMTVASNAFSFFGILDVDPLSASNEVDKVSISPSDSPYRNRVIVEQGSNFTLTEIAQAMAPTAAGTADANTGIYRNVIPALALAGYYYQLVVTLKNNAGTTVQTETIYAQYNGHTEAYVKGKSTWKMNLETFAFMNAGAYVANPAFS
jgi:hypothetical protein